MNPVSKCICLAFCLSLLGGCAATIPTESYTPQNIVRYEQGRTVDVGRFTYAPLTDPEQKLQPNQIQNRAVGNIFISSNVADLVRRITALELEKTGVKLNDSSPIAIAGDVLELKADDIGYSVHWTYAIRYKIVQKADGSALYSQEYRPQMQKTGKFGLAGDYGATVHEIIHSGYDMFIRDPKVRALLEQRM